MVLLIFLRVFGLPDIQGCVLLLLLGSLIVIEVARTIDTYLRDKVFNINIIRFVFTVASMGLIVAGTIEIINDLFVQDNFESYNVQYIFQNFLDL